MKCPVCGKNTFMEMETGGDDQFYMTDKGGYSIKECMNCEYKVEDKIIDGRFVRVNHVITKPDMSKVGS